MTHSEAARTRETTHIAIGRVDVHTTVAEVIHDVRALVAISDFDGSEWGDDPVAEAVDWTGPIRQIPPGFTRGGEGSTRKTRTIGVPPPLRVGAEVNGPRDPDVLRAGAELVRKMRILFPDFFRGVSDQTVLDTVQYKPEEILKKLIENPKDFFETVWGFFWYVLPTELYRTISVVIPPIENLVKGLLHSPNIGEDKVVFLRGRSREEIHTIVKTGHDAAMNIMKFTGEMVTYLGETRDPIIMVKFPKLVGDALKDFQVMSILIGQASGDLSKVIVTAYRSRTNPMTGEVSTKVTIANEEAKGQVVRDIIKYTDRVRSMLERLRVVLASLTEEPAK